MNTLYLDGWNELKRTGTFIRQKRETLTLLNLMQSAVFKFYNDKGEANDKCRHLRPKSN